MKNVKLLAILLVSLAACKTPPPAGPVCIHYANYGLICARTDDPENTYHLNDDQAEGYVCRPAEYEKQMLEWIKRELESK